MKTAEVLVLLGLALGATGAYSQIRSADGTKAGDVANQIVNGQGGGAGAGEAAGMAPPASAPAADDGPSLWDRYVAFMRSDAIPAGEDSPWMREFALSALQGAFYDKTAYVNDPELEKAAIWGEIVAGFTPVAGSMAGVRDGIFWSVEAIAAETPEARSEALGELGGAVVGIIPFARGATKAWKNADRLQTLYGVGDGGGKLVDAYGGDGSRSGTPTPQPAPAPPPAPPP